MRVRLNYYLKIKNIMKKDFDIFEVNESKSLKNILLEYIDKDKISQINLSEILVICDGKNVENLDFVVENDSEFSICPKIYGG